MASESEGEDRATSIIGLSDRASYKLCQPGRPITDVALGAKIRCYLIRIEWQQDSSPTELYEIRNISRVHVVIARGMGSGCSLTIQDKIFPEAKITRLSSQRGREPELLSDRPGTGKVLVKWTFQQLRCPSYYYYPLPLRNMWSLT